MSTYIQLDYKIKLVRQHKVYDVLVIAPSRKTRGGITSVVKLLEQHKIWNYHGCYWLETHIDRNQLIKTWYFIKSFITFFFIIHKYQIVHIHFSEPPSAIRKFFFMYPSRLLNRKIILHFHSFSAETTINSIYKKLYKWMFDNADAVVVLSNYWKLQVSAIMKNPARLCIIHNPAKLSCVDSPRRKIILFAGSLIPRKGYKDLLEAFSYVHRWHKDWHLIMAGNGDLLGGRQLADKLGISKHVSFPGWINGEHKDELFRSASIFCLPSYAEGFPMAVIDAMSFDIPVITTPVGGVLDIFSDSEDVLFIQPGAIKELAMKLDMLILYPDIGEKLVKSSRQKLFEKFDINIVAARLNNLYGQLANEC